ncbi:hypothetical protein QA640_42500 [Bradyrhizobium sp. CB82]|uniref:hypothetical protein n=1 Tax=Bradyrhizobium sp. CB82 TaxID=3039159 RepID=UPI0024B13086|nr:hypothetical protein [Bradyrhizobium sp. CB82]WFU40755.1 hypothetical protein QA640_42500 [Bradyrhizobium sp. CB82]
MDVDPSTLSRSISQQAFSPDMAEKAHALLKAGIPSGALADEARSPVSSEDPMLILHKFADMMPEVAGALRTVLAARTTGARRDA